SSTVSIPQSGKFYFKRVRETHNRSNRSKFQSLNRENSISSIVPELQQPQREEVSIPQSGKFYFKLAAGLSSAIQNNVSIPQSGKFYFKLLCGCTRRTRIFRFNPSI